MLGARLDARLGTWLGARVEGALVDQPSLSDPDDDAIAEIAGAIYAGFCASRRLLKDFFVCPGSFGLEPLSGGGSGIDKVDCGC